MKTKKKTQKATNELVQAVKSGNQKKFWKAIDNGACIASLRRLIYPIMCQASHKHSSADIAQALLDNGADPNASGTDLNDNKIETVSPIMVAAKNGRKDIMLILLNHGADPRDLSNIQQREFSDVIAAASPPQKNTLS